MTRTRLLAAALLVSCGCAAGEVQDVLINTPQGATLSALVALPGGEARVPAILTFDIYANPEAQKVEVARLADLGYAGVYAYARGKYRSPDPITPYELEARDASAVVDWIARQPWSNGKVGMIGGSYNGFTAWAAAKYRPRALKAIAVSAAAIPGQGLPMYNNVFQNSNYAWTFYVTNDKLLDEKTYSDNRWWAHPRNWFMSGRPYRELDAVDGTPNPLFQRWLQHPAFDAYWQSMVPYGKEFARLDMPALTITGYYDAAQISALQYYREHVRWRRNAEHYVVIGPYDHFGTHGRVKPTELRGYAIDTAAQLDSPALKLAFMDYVLRGAPKPQLLADRINYEVMGANEWRHAPTVAAMHPHTRRLYFSAGAGGGKAMNALAAQAPPAGSAVVLDVDLADRVEFHGYHAFPNPIVQGPLEYITESLFESEPFAAATTLSGPFTGELDVTINKKDFDPTVAVYEKRPDGKLFHLGFAMLRASFAKDPTRRELLEPGVATRIRFETTWIAKRLEPGSRLLVLLDTNKNPMAQVNYGTGGDVSGESVQDAGEPLRIRWNAGSFLDVPVD